MSLGRRRQLRVDPANSVPRVQMAAFGALQPAHHRDKKGTIDVKTKNKHQTSGGEVMELARETAKLEQYWIVGDRSKPRKPPKDYDYVEELINLQIELKALCRCFR